MDLRIQQLAKNLVNYSVKVKKGENVYISHTGESTRLLAIALVKEVYAVGGVPFIHYSDTRLQREMLLNCNDDQLKLMAEIACLEMSKMDCYIGVRGSDNIAEIYDDPAEK